MKKQVFSTLWCPGSKANLPHFHSIVARVQVYKVRWMVRREAGRGGDATRRQAPSVRRGIVYPPKRASWSCAADWAFVACVPVPGSNSTKYRTMGSCDGGCRRVRGRVCPERGFQFSDTWLGGGAPARLRAPARSLIRSLSGSLDRSRIRSLACTRYLVGGGCTHRRTG